MYTNATPVQQVDLSRQSHRSSLRSNPRSAREAMCETGYVASLTAPAKQHDRTQEEPSGDRAKKRKPKKRKPKSTGDGVEQVDAGASAQQQHRGQQAESAPKKPRQRRGSGRNAAQLSGTVAPTDPDGNNVAARNNDQARNSGSRRGNDAPTESHNGAQRTSAGRGWWRHRTRGQGGASSNSGQSGHPANRSA